MLRDNIVGFLEHFGEESLVGRAFYEIVREGDGETKFARLLKATGFEHDHGGFFAALTLQLAQANSHKREPVMMNGIMLPRLLLVSLMEEILPGDQFTPVHDVAQLEAMTQMRFTFRRGILRFGMV